MDRENEYLRVEEFSRLSEAERWAYFVKEMVPDPQGNRQITPWDMNQQRVCSRCMLVSDRWLTISHIVNHITLGDG